jgi:ABC-type nitrate/sulfonate/bicarbonate transport system substrate-binding protein
MRATLALPLCTAALAFAASAGAQDTKVNIGISGWTGFAPLTLPRRPASTRRTAST